MSDKDSHNSESDFGANEWLVAEMYGQWLVNPDSVDKSWWQILERYHLAQAKPQTAPAPEPANSFDSGEPATGSITIIDTDSTIVQAFDADAPAPPTEAITIPVAKTTDEAPKTTPVPADLPATGTIPLAIEQVSDEPEITILRGMSKTLATNMDASLSMPTATSVRQVAAKVMIDNRIVINSHLKRTRGGKISFTHLIGYAVVQAIKEFPSQNVFYDEVDGKPALVSPANVNFGLAIDIPKPDGSRALLVPNIKRAQNLNFSEFLFAYEALVKKARDNKLTAEDFAGTTISLTNPGGIGTVHSVPRLTRGQGCIVGVGALDYPAQYQGMAEEVLAQQGLGKILTLTSTYDHRVIQGAGSGEFLKIVNELLLGERSFYEKIYSDMRIPYTPVMWVSDFHWDLADQSGKNTRIQEYINAFRVRGHLIADIDPLEYVQRWHSDLDIRTYGLSLWDLDRTFKTAGFGGRSKAKFRNMLGILRDSYCRTIGVEYMHIQNPIERQWFQNKLERPYEKPSKAEQFRILNKLNEAEAFETFLQTKFVGQKRFSLEGSESLIPALDEILQQAADSQLDEVAIGMAHRGRLNVLTNIAGKTYGQVFREFEGSLDLKSVQGSGDVKYHLGTEGIFTSGHGSQIKVSLAANPSHLEAVNPVLEGIVRAKQDRMGNPDNYPVLPVLIHGDAAFAGQGVVPETLNMSQLEAYKVGGTIHIVVNNQVGFTTLPKDSRSSVYSTDIAKSIQAPIFHVNGDDPEAVVRVSKLAFEYRRDFQKDVVIDIVCYRRRGHNEGDDPSMTQPLMYNLVEAKRSVRTLYMENLIGRGDISQEEFDQANASFQKSLEQAFVDVHEAMSQPVPLLTRPQGIGTTASEKQELIRPTAIAKEIVDAIGNAHANQPDGFSVHPKLAQLLQKRQEMSRDGGIDWGYGELMAFGSLLLEGINVRLVGQDSRRGTFVQRHAVFHDRETGQEWTPLKYISENQARFDVYNSLLSEYATMGFEYGYSVEEPATLTLWEAQFGDFVNGAQIVVDEFITSAEQKWSQHSSLVLLLPHGYEGQGPDHSSARIERFLQLCAENNMTVAQPSTPASHFHLLRRQAYTTPKRPLIVFAPKSMLRLKAASSSVEDFTNGSFRPLINDEQGLDPNNVKRVLFCSGKIYWDLLAESQKRNDGQTAIIRIEQLYPTPVEEMRQAVGQFPNAELIWVQDEPVNQGPWTYMGLFMPRYGLNLRAISRPASASPASGSAKRHATEQADLIQRAFGA
ncbi:multifunctional oxoglutarate decarboxylase/oxoglutarate dehydrogenase thiamine pyrophosphate-binding subunit/dihydrolipoyllysine-residue succinyltransferase subunit [Candidatus Aquiluna sp. UB-MaderosW2red]|uniref:multifunctional oxoglutarate decarboxylase/oxoglutarate dehydrogenase thiamine pyrophosphate-binding subunit/dihydrolipoyllysine-residue succinyltransferase subunit n=1 Tax=Candidatus Aquiluna sp. UB-MaderosW2red TaxID=1855377 RepID=UPI000875CFC9|nr:multifunctional oxoglutarate decarboxylase/oxoglutarate dehydrogenase thiamine pyrophosphate-binding subunit/dihydrolipoyllysine-residue succinyltransferase subunit [Candidatus Aquiluna sp. UB-MaderosW2red]SCX09066.1 2-oxoglutarate dehydrogenase E1 component [Candidatus Aquiluna sp. UB-MaderosW2red]